MKTTTKAITLRLLALALFILFAFGLSAAVHNLHRPIAWLHAGQAAICCLLGITLSVKAQIMDPIGEEEEN